MSVEGLVRVGTREAKERRYTTAVVVALVMTIVFFVIAVVGSI